jgi:hypothetical protein
MILCILMVLCVAVHEEKNWKMNRKIYKQILFVNLSGFFRSTDSDYFLNFLIISSCLYGLVVRVPGYRSRGPGSIARDFLRSSGSGTGSTQPREYN